MIMNEPLVFDIKRSSTSDGPGLRTVVFFKGCNLDCFWCHNPEGKRAHAEMAFFESKCIGCATCKKICRSTRECIACGECATFCPTDALRLYGKHYSADELFEIISTDKPYFDATGGGVTFSGGECMLYPDYIAELASLCKKNGIGVAIDTAGCVPFDSFERVLPYADLFLYDLKAIDPDLHKRGTGRENRLILENLDRLIAAGKRIMIRVPVIPDFNDGDELERIKDFCAKRALECELLPYHEFGIDKKAALESFLGKNRG